ncbi:repeat organellar [Cryptosporidium sp. chipmunk genotype I]|uniref:repeat organellar n=1 Tax=Cryptosporidium sp. chipmunk genotype I TaxID=1280935 RepID=UPI00351A1DCC|nr:repeat organellar [Cryptosporidium sp. chipmunk genotype I]
MEIKKTAQMQQDEIFQENLELFLRNCELNREVGWREVENTDLLNRLNDYKENQRSLELFIKKLKEDEIDSYLGEISAKSQLKESQKMVRDLGKYNEYLKTMLRKYMNAGCHISKILNGGKISSEVLFKNESEDEFRESLKKCLSMLELLSMDVEEQAKYKDRYKVLKLENKDLKTRIEKLVKEKPKKKVRVEVSLSIIEPHKSNGELIIDTKKVEEIFEQLNSGSVDTALEDEGTNNEEIDMNYEIDCLHYLIKQYKKENFELKQKIFEYEFNNTNLNVEEIVESELKDKQRELDDLEKEYSNWVIRLQEENSELRKVIEIQEKKQSEFIDNFIKKSREKAKDTQNMQIKLVENYEERLREKDEELRKLKSESIRGEKDSIEIESLNRIVKSLEEKLVTISSEKHFLSLELEKTAKDFKDTEQKLVFSEEAIKQKDKEFDCLKVEQEKILEQYYNEKKLHQKFEQDAHSLRKELDNVLSDMYKSQKKTRSGIVGDSMDSDKISSVEAVIEHCKELESKVDELSCELDQLKSGKSVNCSNSNLNNAEIETLFDQVQGLRREREQLKKDIRQRDWAKVEVEILHKRTTEEIEQLKRDNTRLMLENLRLRDSGVAQSSQKQVFFNTNSENIQANSTRSSISGDKRELSKKSSSVTAPSNPEEINPVNSNVSASRNSIQSKLNLKAPRRPSLLVHQRNYSEKQLY